MVAENFWRMAAIVAFLLGCALGILYIITHTGNGQ